MAKKGSLIVDYFNNRGFFGLAIVLMVIFSVIASGNFVVPQRGYGTFHNLATWIAGSDTSCFVAILCNTVMGVLLVTLNMMFRFIKNFNCFVFAALFVLMQGINPFLSTRFFAGTAMCLVVMVALFLMFEQYGNPATAPRSIFLVMALLAFASIYHYVFLLLVPLFILGFAYMRVLDVRGFFAIAFGMITPYWIALGMRIESFNDLQPPQLQLVWDAAPQFAAKGWAVTVAIVTVALSVLLTVANFKTMLNFSVHVRAYNNFFVALLAFVVVMMGIDYNDFLIYMPLLNMCFAIQFGHWYVITRHETRQPVTTWLFVLLVAAFIVAMIVA